MAEHRIYARLPNAKGSGNLIRPGHSIQDGKHPDFPVFLIRMVEPFLYPARGMPLEIPDDRLRAFRRVIQPNEQMEMIAHDDIAVKDKALVGLAVRQTIQDNPAACSTGKEIYPSANGKRDEVYTLWIGDLVSPEREIILGTECGVFAHGEINWWRFKLGGCSFNVKS